MRYSNIFMDQLIEENKIFPVLDKGHIRVVDYMGGDESVVQAARVSYGKGTKTVSEDKKLINYLMVHHHSTPFEMCEIKIHVKVPMDAWRQWIRHRMASVNEYSTRYSEAIDDKQVTDPDKWRLQSTKNKQGSGEFLKKWPEDVKLTDEMEAMLHFGNSPGMFLSKQEKWLHEQSTEIYKNRLLLGVAREQARKDLPLSTYTEAYWKMDLKNLLHFLNLRMDPHAQKEIREYAEILGNQIVAKWVPYTWEAFNKLTFETRF